MKTTLGRRQEVARRFAEHLKRKYFANLYYEVSTNGNGTHEGRARC
jgi:hypothetical protein